ncbi:MAG: acyltransferase [Deltaproteobacteria bacterium]|nr:acyltransferase [Deltaproteobacteria bacterium]
MRYSFAYIRAWLLGMRCHSFGKGNQVGPSVHVIHPEFVAIGSKVVIHKDTVIHVAPKDKSTKNAVIRIGDNVHLSFRTWIAGRVGITIGDNVGFAPGVVIQDYIHGYDDPHVPIKDQALTGEAPIHIGSGSVLGANVIVLPGVTIGQHCMIGGNAVVSKDIPDHSLAVGNPVRVVKRYDDKSSAWVRA